MIERIIRCNISRDDRSFNVQFGEQFGTIHKELLLDARFERFYDTTIATERAIAFCLRTEMGKN